MSSTIRSLDLECRLNGRVVQWAPTADLVIGVAELIASISSLVTLRPGEVIPTGTPLPSDGGLPRLTPGDRITTGITGIGVLDNHCTVEPSP